MPREQVAERGSAAPAEVADGDLAAPTDELADACEAAAESAALCSGSPEAACGEVDMVTLAGLIFETAAGLRRTVVPPLERDYDLPPQSLEVLIRLSRSPYGRLRMSDLAAQTALSPSGLTRAVDRLCEAGLVSRQTCPEDRRGSFATLTPDGSRRMGAAMDIHRAKLSVLLSDILDGSELEQLAQLLRRIRDHLNPHAARVSSE